MSKQRNLINDTIYNHIEYSFLESKLLQTKIVNRLLFITQNALAYFAFPSITTKRYIHSLGTMHLSAHIFKNAVSNADQKTKSSFLKSLKISIEKIIKDQKIDIELKNFQDNSLYEFMLPLKSKKEQTVYFIALQCVRIAGLLHDVGHFPFSHQVEYALEKIYHELQQKEVLNKKQSDFVAFYKKTTLDNSEVLHETIGLNIVKLLFENELLSWENSTQEKEYIKLIYTIVFNIFNEYDDGVFDYGVLHRIVDGTVDSDRLDYVNRDMVSSGYINGNADFIRITKQAVLTKTKNQNQNRFLITYFDDEIINMEHMLEMRFNLYKKVIFSSDIAVSDALLENVIIFLARNYFASSETKDVDDISLLWNFWDMENCQKKLDLVSMLDENWLISLFKKEYFSIKYKNDKDFYDKKYIIAFEDILFGRKFYKSLWNNLNDLYNLLEFDKKQRYQFRESFGFVGEKKFKKLQKLLDQFCEQNETKGGYFTYTIVSINIGIEKDFLLYDGKKHIKIDEVSTLRKRLKKSTLNTVPFYIYSNKKELTKNMKTQIKQIIQEVFQ